MNILNLYSDIESIHGVIKNVCEYTQKSRIQLFVRSCKKAFKNDGKLSDDDEVNFKKIFNNEFAKKHVYDFLRKSADCTSSIGRAAMALLYVQCNLREFPHLTTDEMHLFRAYSEMDDRDAKIILKIFEIKKTDRNLLPVITHFSRSFSECTGLELSTIDWEKHSCKFVDLEIESSFEFRSISDWLISKRIFGLNPNGLDSIVNGDLMSLIETPISLEFIRTLDYSKKIADSL